MFTKMSISGAQVGFSLVRLKLKQNFFFYFLQNTGKQVHGQGNQTHTHMDNLLACFGYGWRFCRSTSGYCSVFLTIFYWFLTFLTIFQANKVFTILMTWLAWDSLLLYVHREPTGVSGRHKNVRDTLQYAALWNFTSSWNSLLSCS